MISWPYGTTAQDVGLNRLLKRKDLHMNDLSHLDYLDGLGTPAERHAFRLEKIASLGFDVPRQHSRGYLIVRGTVRILLAPVLATTLMLAVVAIILLAVSNV